MAGLLDGSNRFSVFAGATIQMTPLTVKDLWPAVLLLTISSRAVIAVSVTLRMEAPSVVDAEKMLTLAMSCPTVVIEGAAGKVMKALDCVRTPLISPKMG